MLYMIEWQIYHLDFMLKIQVHLDAVQSTAFWDNGATRLAEPIAKLSDTIKPFNITTINVHIIYTHRCFYMYI